MKKIAILSLHLGYGGIEKSIVALANMLSDKYKIEIVSSYKLYDEPAFDINKKVKVKYLIENYIPNREDFKRAVEDRRIKSIFKEGFKSAKILRLRKKTMVNYIKNTDADIVISTRDIFDEWLGVYGPKEVLKIGWEHNHYHDDLKYADRITRASSKLDYLVLVSKSLQKYYVKRLRKSNCKCVYIPNVLDSVPKKVSKLESKRIISVGRLSHEKGYDDLIRIFSVVSKKYKDWVLDIVGDGNEKKRLERIIKSLKLDNRVTLHGFRGKDYIDELMDRSSMYVMTSHTESFGIVLLEAMSHGLPCIAFSSAEGARELIASGKNGYLIKNRSYNAMIKKINDLIKNEDERKKIGKEAYKSIKKYTSAVVEEQWLQVLEKK